MKRILIAFTIMITAVAYQQASAQGCVAIRANGNTCSMAKPGGDQGWTLNFNTRYFRSYKHFVGTIEQKERVEKGTQVVNHTFAEDLTLTKSFNKYWSLAVDVPILSNVRSSLYEHANSRHSTRSFGLGDIRLTAYRWIFDPAKAHKGNIQAGFGLKLPTGNYRVQDYFYKSDGIEALGYVDQSIQLGDGGTGLSAEVNGYYNISHNWGLYGNFYYLANPMEQNGVQRSAKPSRNDTLYGTVTFSVPDQYMARAGVNYMVQHFTFSAGLRIECVPSSDLIGGDGGFRRPGDVISAEPVIAYQAKKINLYVSVPVAIQRNRTQSNADKLRSAATGTHVQGDAAFADYTVNVGFTVKF